MMVNGFFIPAPFATEGPASSRRARDKSVSGQLLVDEFPRVRPVEPANPDGRDELRIEVPEVHPVLRARLHFQRLPMRDTATGPAVNGAKRLVSPNVRR